MQVVTSIGEKYETLDKASDAVIAADKAWAENPGSKEHEDAFNEAVREMNRARDAVDGQHDREQASKDFEALLADAMDQGEREAFDAHYDRQPLPCEVDTVDPDPWVEDSQAVAADLQADARAREIEGQS